MKKNLVSLLLVGALVAPGALVLAQESEDSGTIEETTQESFEEETTVDPGEDFVEDYQSDEENEITILSAPSSLSESGDNGNKGTEEELSEAKTNAIAIVEDSSLSEDDKKAFIGSINRSETIERVEYWSNFAKRKSNEIEAEKEKEELEKELKDAKESALEEIEGLTLSDESKEVYKNRIEASETINIVDAVLADARNESAVTNDLDVIRKNALDELNLLNLDEDVRDAHKGSISRSDSIDDVNYWLNMARRKSAENDATELEAKREFVLEQLEELGFSEEELNDFVERVKVAESSEGIDNIFEEAKAKSDANDKTVHPEFYIGVVRNDFPQFDAEGNEYEVVIGEEVTTITITDKDGKLVAVIEYNEDTDTTKIKSIPATPIQPGVNTKVIVDGVKEKFPTFDNEDYTYETEVTETKVIVTIKNKEGHLVAVVEYDREKEAYSVKPAELTPAKPIEKDDESTVEESEVVDVVTADGQPVQVVRTDSRSELPETGELGGATAMMAAALSALGGLGLLFKKRK